MTTIRGWQMNGTSGRLGIVYIENGQKLLASVYVRGYGNAKKVAKYWRSFVENGSLTIDEIINLVILEEERAKDKRKQDLCK